MLSLQDKIVPIYAAQPRCYLALDSRLTQFVAPSLHTEAHKQCQPTPVLAPLVVYLFLGVIMGKSVVSPSMKTCGTCSRWLGARDPGRIIPASVVWIDSSYTRGLCAGGAYPNLPMSPLATCDKYQKWSVLK